MLREKGGGSLGKIFGICGDYEVDGKWRSNNNSVAFKGWFVLDENDTFFGVCMEEFDENKPQRRVSDYIHKKNASIPRVIVGSLEKRSEGHDYKIVFYMMSNNASISPLRYTIPDLGTEHPDEKGYWEWATNDGFQVHGSARVSIQQYSRESKIAESFLRKQLDGLRNINGNRKYVEEVLRCS